MQPRRDGDPARVAHLGDQVAIDGTLIDAVLSMQWAEYRDGLKKAKAHSGFDLNRSLFRVFLTEGNGGEKPFVILKSVGLCCQSHGIQ